jgi:hypothetical protein
MKPGILQFFKRHFETVEHGTPEAYVNEFTEDVIYIHEANRTYRGREGTYPKP